MVGSLSAAARQAPRRVPGGRALCLFACFAWSVVGVSAGELKVAVAANFAAPMAELAASFEEATEHSIVLVPGSSGRLYAQIRQGAPYDVFFSADRERVERLVEEGPAVPGSAFVYARGRLVLWSADATRSVAATTLRTGAFRRLAIANPRLAPYGAAAEETLRALGRWDALEPRLVRGESVTQAFQFVASGAAELGLVAKSQVLAAGGAAWEVPAELHRPIEQAAVALRAVAGALDLLQHVREEGGEVLRRHGYEVP